MSGLSKISIVLFLLLSMILASLLSLQYLPVRIINGFEVTGCEQTYQISKMLTPLIGRGYYQIRKRALRHNLEQLPYVRHAEAGYENGKLSVSITAPSESLILKSRNSSYFLDDSSLMLLDPKDDPALKRMYIVLELGDGYLEYLLKYGFDPFFRSTVDALMKLDAYHNLIDKAEYDNNKSTGKGELRLALGPVNAKLRVYDSLSPGRLETVIAVIRDEQWKEGRNVFLSSATEYELRSGQLIRLKG